MQQIKKDKPPTRVRWIARFIIGTILIGSAIAIPFTSPEVTWKEWLAVAILACFALQDFWAGWKGRKSWLENIGPLP